MFFVAVEGPLGSLLGAVMLLGLIVLCVGLRWAAPGFCPPRCSRGCPPPLRWSCRPFRRPKVGQVLVRSVLDRTLFVLGRAVTVAAPAGLGHLAAGQPARG